MCKFQRDWIKPIRQFDFLNFFLGFTDYHHQIIPIVFVDGLEDIDWITFFLIEENEELSLVPAVTSAEGQQDH